MEEQQQTAARKEKQRLQAEQMEHQARNSQIRMLTQKRQHDIVGLLIKIVKRLSTKAHQSEEKNEIIPDVSSQNQGGGWLQSIGEAVFYASEFQRERAEAAQKAEEREQWKQIDDLGCRLETLMLEQDHARGTISFLDCQLASLRC